MSAPTRSEHAGGSRTPIVENSRHDVPRTPPALTQRKRRSWTTRVLAVLGARAGTTWHRPGLRAPVGSGSRVADSASEAREPLPDHVRKRLALVRYAATLPGVTLIDLGPGHIHVYDDHGRPLEDMTQCPVR